ncbi:MAG: MFS transporter [Steroidobacteraceae bacterium]|jgi:MFS family permease
MARSAHSLFVYLLAAVLFINYVDRGAMPTAGPMMLSDLHLSNTQFGFLISAFSWTYVLFQIPVGWLAERYGAHRILAAGLIVWASATLLIGLSSTFTVLFALRLLLGIGESTGFPSVSKLLAAAVPTQSLGTANGIVGFAYLFGPAVGTFVGGLLMANFGWRSAFFVFGGLSLLWLLPWSRVVRAQRSVVRTEVSTPTLWTLLKSRALWGTALGLFSSNYTFYFILAWLPVYLVRERGFSTVEMAQLASASYLVMALCALGAGWAVDRYIKSGGSANIGYKSIMAAAHGGAVLCMLAMAFGPRPLALGGIFVFQALCGASSPGVYAIPQILGGAKAAGRWVSIQNSVGNLAGIFAPALTGLIIDLTGQFTLACVLAAAMSLLGLVGWLGMLPELRQIDWDTRAP